MPRNILEENISTAFQLYFKAHTDQESLTNLTKMLQDYPYTSLTITNMALVSYKNVYYDLEGARIGRETYTDWQQRREYSMEHHESETLPNQSIVKEVQANLTINEKIQMLNLLQRYLPNKVKSLTFDSFEFLSRTKSGFFSRSHILPETNQQANEECMAFKTALNSLLRSKESLTGLGIIRSNIGLAEEGDTAYWPQAILDAVDGTNVRSLNLSNNDISNNTTLRRLPRNLTSLSLDGNPATPTERMRRMLEENKHEQERPQRVGRVVAMDFVNRNDVPKRAQQEIVSYIVGKQTAKTASASQQEEEKKEDGPIPTVTGPLATELDTITGRNPRLGR
jgi:hypothetical protein